MLWHACAGSRFRSSHGVWWLDGQVDPYRLAEHLTAPFPAYLSLQTALHLHGMIEQIPAVFFAVSLARTQKIVTTVGTYSVHHVAAELFGGFAETSEGVKVATAEKALFDLAYLSGSRSRFFTNVTELELPRDFRWHELRHWLDRIPTTKRKTFVTRRLGRLLASTSTSVRLPRWIRPASQFR